MATSTTTVTFVGAKGGVGTSTVAALRAIQLVRQGRTVRLTSADSAGVDDLAALLGVPAPGPGEPVVVIPGLTLADHPGADVDNVVDAGTDCFSDHRGTVYVVVRNVIRVVRAWDSGFRLVSDKRPLRGFIPHRRSTSTFRSISLRTLGAGPTNRPRVRPRPS